MCFHDGIFVTVRNNHFGELFSGNRKMDYVFKMSINPKSEEHRMAFLLRTQKRENFPKEP